MKAEPLALIINAGGQSRRLGRNKALLPVPPDNTPLFVHIARRLSHLVTDRVVVVSDDPHVASVASSLDNVLVLGDGWPGGGALGGVATGLRACVGWAMVVACDMPLVDPAIFAKLRQEAMRHTGLNAVIPVIRGDEQPFHGLWHAHSMPTLEDRLAQNQLAVRAALHALKVVWLDEGALGIEEDSLAFYNVNTQPEWDQFLTIWEKRKSR